MKPKESTEIIVCIAVIAVSLLVDHVNSQILWDRLAPIDGGNVGVPRDCSKQWSSCYYAGPDPSARFGAYYHEEVVTVRERNGGICNLGIERFCDASCISRPPCVLERRDCIKKWSECFGIGVNSYRIELEDNPAQNGGECELGYEFGCNSAPSSVDCVKTWGKCIGVGPQSKRTETALTPAKHGGKCEIRTQKGCNPHIPVDCRKRWDRCTGNGPTSQRMEIEVTPAKHGGKCKLAKEFGCRFNPVDCVKKWGKCTGVGEKSSRKEIVVRTAEHGGSCELRTEKECNAPPQDCVKRWGNCVGVGTSSFRDEKVITREKYGGTCELRRDFGCNQHKPVDCTKKWRKCTGNGPTSQRMEIEVTPAKYGGICRLKKETGCNFTPVDCVKKWGKCTGVGEKSSRKEIIVERALYGGSCELRTQKKCNTAPQDCVKRWENCKGTGPSSFRDEIVVTTEKYGGTCELRREFGCSKAVDCVKTWGQCIREGETSYRREVVKTRERFGGKRCADFKTEMGCNKPKKPPAKDEDDSPGKKVATLLIGNFVVDIPASARSATTQRRTLRAGARTLLNPFGFSLPGNAESAKNNDMKKNCTEFRDGSRLLAVGCDEADDIDPDIIKEEQKRTVRVGEKRISRNLERRRRSTDDSTSTPQKLPTPRDVLFLLDSSGSVNRYHFSVLKEICKAIVDVLCGRISLGKYQTRIAMGTFNRRQILSFPFSNTSSTVAVKKKIDDVEFDYVYSFQSCIKDALTFVLSDIYLEKNGARDPGYSEGDLFIMTDGCANCDYSEDNKELQRMAYRLKLNKINVYAIGVGINGSCRNILKVLARGGRCFHFFFLNDWDVDVEDFLFRLKNPPQERCLDRWEFPGINCLDNKKA